MVEWAIAGSVDEARQYVWVNDDGSVRELADGEVSYLMEAFSPGDGDRPYIKPSYGHRTPDGRIGGFMHRGGLPARRAVGRPAKLTPRRRSPIAARSFRARPLDPA